MQNENLDRRIERRVGRRHRDDLDGDEHARAARQLALDARPLPFRHRQRRADRGLRPLGEQIVEPHVVRRIRRRLATEPDGKRPIDLRDPAIGRQLQHAERQPVVVGEPRLETAERLGDPRVLLRDVGNLPQRPRLALAAAERRRDWPHGDAQPARGARAPVLAADTELLLPGFAALDRAQQPEKALAGLGLAREGILDGTRLPRGVLPDNSAEGAIRLERPSRRVRDEKSEVEPLRGALVQIGPLVLDIEADQPRRRSEQEENADHGQQRQEAEHDRARRPGRPHGRDSEHQRRRERQSCRNNDTATGRRAHRELAAFLMEARHRGPP